MKDQFDLKKECIFVSLASYAHDIITQGDTEAFNGEAMYMANAIDKHFKKVIKRYSKARMKKLEDYLRNVMTPAFPEKLNSSVIMAASLNYLLNEDHYESKLVFSPFKYKISNIITTLEKSEFKDELKKANETLIKMLDSRPSEFKSNIDKEKVILVQYKLSYLLKDLINSVEITGKLEKPFTKINNLINTYLKDIELPYIDLDKNNLDELNKVYYITAIVNKLKTITGYRLDIIDKLKTINLNYLTPNKEALKACDKQIESILL